MKEACLSVEEHRAQGRGTPTGGRVDRAASEHHAAVREDDIHGIPRAPTPLPTRPPPPPIARKICRTPARSAQTLHRGPGRVSRCFPPQKGWLVAAPGTEEVVWRCEMESRPIVSLSAALALLGGWLGGRRGLRTSFSDYRMVQESRTSRRGMEYINVHEEKCSNNARVESSIRAIKIAAVKTYIHKSSIVR